MHVPLQRCFDNIQQLAFLWFYVIPFPLYIELALGYTLNDEYFEEIGEKHTAILTGGLFLSFNMTQTDKRVILIISYLIIPLLIILAIRANDLSVERTRAPLCLVPKKGSQFESVSSRIYIGDVVLHRLQENGKLLLKILSIGKAPILVYQAVQNSCDHCKKIGARCSLRLFWALLALISSIVAVICSVIIAAICLVLI